MFQSLILEHVCGHLFWVRHGTTCVGVGLGLEDGVLVKVVLGVEEGRGVGKTAS